MRRIRAGIMRIKRAAITTKRLKWILSLTNRLKSIDFENLEGKDSKFSFKEDLGRRLKSNSMEFQRLAEGRRRPASDIV